MFLVICVGIVHLLNCVRKLWRTCVLEMLAPGSGWCEQCTGSFFGEGVEKKFDPPELNFKTVDIYFSFNV